MLVAIEITGSDARWRRSNRQIHRCLERTIAVAENDADVGRLLGKGQVLFAIAIQIGGHYCSRIASAENRSGRLERAVAVAVQQPDVVAGTYVVDTDGDRQILLSVASEIGNGDR